MAAIGRRDGREWLAHGACVALTGCYVVLRTGTAMREVGPWLDGAAILVGAQAALWCSSRCVEGRSLFRRPLQVAALLWPLAAAVVVPRVGSAGGALLSFLVALHYSVAARAVASRHLSVPALLCGNAALFLSWAALEWSDVLLYALPVAATLLALVHIYGAELGRSGANVLRGLVLVSIYSLSVGRGLVSTTPLQALLLVPTLCVAGIVAGLLLRVRAYVLLGVGFLAADLVLTMVRYGLSSRPLGALFLTLLGLVLVAAMVVFSLERDRILRRYSVILGELRTWE
jgi:hypothetical protein